MLCAVVAPVYVCGESASRERDFQQSQEDKAKNNGDDNKNKNDDFEVKKSGDTAHGYPRAEQNTNRQEDKSKDSSKKEEHKNNIGIRQTESLLMGLKVPELYRDDHAATSWRTVCGQGDSCASGYDAAVDSCKSKVGITWEIIGPCSDSDGRKRQCVSCEIKDN